MREITAACLAKVGISCITASSAEEAISALNNNAVTLTLLDWGLKGAMDTSGEEVLSFCKENYPLMPVVVMSGLPIDVKSDAIVKRADGFLQKPLSAMVIISQVSVWLERLRGTPKIFLPQREEDIMALDDFKRLYIRHVVRLLNGNVSLAGEKLGSHRQTVSAALKNQDGTDLEPPITTNN